MAVVEIGGLFRPVDGGIDLPDFHERGRRVLQPCGDAPVLGVGADDGVDVAVENGQAPGVPIEGEPRTRMRRRPSFIFGRPWTESRRAFVELDAVRRHALGAQRGRVRDRVDGEVVAVVVELELHHPVDEFGCRRAGPGRHDRVELEKVAAGVADDAAGVIGAHDHLQR